MRTVLLVPLWTTVSLAFVLSVPVQAMSLVSQPETDAKPGAGGLEVAGDRVGPVPQNDERFSEHRALKRVRRGWMWNQFFLQEEYTGSDHQYIGKVGPGDQSRQKQYANAVTCFGVMFEPYQLNTCCTAK